jgi:hypothetical protein
LHLRHHPIFFHQEFCALLELEMSWGKNFKHYPIKLPSIYLKFSLKQAKGQTNFCLSFPPMGQSNCTRAMGIPKRGIRIHSGMQSGQTRPRLANNYFLFQWRRYLIPVRSVECKWGGGTKVGCVCCDTQNHARRVCWRGWQVE